MIAETWHTRDGKTRISHNSPDCYRVQAAPSQVKSSSPGDDPHGDQAGFRHAENFGSEVKELQFRTVGISSAAARTAKLVRWHPDRNSERGDEPCEKVQDGQRVLHETRVWATDRIGS